MDAKRKQTPIQRRLASGVASDFISSLSIKPDQEVVLANRASSRQQKSHLIDSEKRLREEVDLKCGIVIAVESRAISGFDPWWLARAAAHAKRHNAILLAETTDRFVRHPAYHSVNNPSAQARQSDLEELRRVTQGVPLMTLLDPDATPSEVRSYQTQRGQQAKAKPGYKKRRKEKLMPRAIELQAKGCSLRMIAKQLGIAYSTINGWLGS